jgi:hypothetical protein
MGLFSYEPGQENQHPWIPEKEGPERIKRTRKTSARRTKVRKITRAYPPPMGTFIIEAKRILITFCPDLKNPDAAVKALWEMVCQKPKKK